MITVDSMWQMVADLETAIQELLRLRLERPLTKNELFMLQDWSRSVAVCVDWIDKHTE